MRHVTLTCRNHPTLRWSCKEIAFTDAHGYNGARHIVFLGRAKGGLNSDQSGPECEDFDSALATWVAECPCPPSDLIRAPEDGTLAQAAWRRAGAHARRLLCPRIPPRDAPADECEAWLAGWDDADRKARASPIDSGPPGRGNRVGG